VFTYGYADYGLLVEGVKLGLH